MKTGESWRGGKAQEGSQSQCGKTPVFKMIGNINNNGQTWGATAYGMD